MDSSRSSVSPPDEFKVACYVSGMITSLYAHLNDTLSQEQKDKVVQLIKYDVLNYEDIAREIIYPKLTAIPGGKHV